MMPLDSYFHVYGHLGHAVMVILYHVRIQSALDSPTIPYDPSLFH